MGMASLSGVQILLHLYYQMFFFFFHKANQVKELIAKYNAHMTYQVEVYTSQIIYVNSLVLPTYNFLHNL